MSSCRRKDHRFDEPPKYIFGTPLNPGLEVRVDDATTAAEFLDWLVESGNLRGGDVLELTYDGIVVPGDLTFGALNLHDGYRLDVIATGTSV